MYTRNDPIINNAFTIPKLSAKACFRWIKSAFNQLKAFPLHWMMWIILLIGVASISFLEPFNPGINLLVVFMYLFCNAGILMAAHAGDRGIRPSIKYLFSLNKITVLRLLSFGACYILLQWIAGKGVEKFQVLTSSSGFSIGLSGAFIYIFSTVLLFLFFCIAFLIPPLIIFQQLSLKSALFLSTKAVRINWWPLLSLFLWLLLFIITISVIEGVITVILIIITSSNWSPLPVFSLAAVLWPLIILIPFYIWKDLFGQSDQVEESNLIEESKIV